jgi:hypothetical protein
MIAFTNAFSLIYAMFDMLHEFQPKPSIIASIKKS